MKHLRVLEAAGVVVARKQRREKRHYLNPSSIESTFEPGSRVMWEIEPQGDGSCCKVTVTHDRLENSPKAAEKVSGGRLEIVSSLKTVVETGLPLKVTIRTIW